MNFSFLLIWLLFQQCISYAILKESDDGRTLTISGNGSINSSSIHELSYDKFEYIIIEDGITRIESSSFKDCHSLISIKFPSKLEYIGDSVFVSCQNIMNIELPEGLLNIPKNLIYYCYKLQNITISSTIETIDPMFMWSCPQMTKFIVSIYNQNFSTVEDGSILTNKNKSIAICCKGSGVIRISEDIEIIGSYFFCQKEISSILFSSNSKLKTLKAKILQSSIKITSFNAPPSLKRVEDQCFFRSSVINVSLPSTLEYLSTSAFSESVVQNVFISENSTAIKMINGIIYNPDGTQIIFIPLSISNLTISEKLQKFDPNLVRTTKSLEGVYVDPNNEKYSSYDDALYSKYKSSFLATPYNKSIVYVHRNCTTIGDRAFMRTLIKEVYFEGDVTKISNEGFSGCSKLTTLDFPSTVKEIGNWVFTDCYSWKGSITFGPNFFYSGSSAFYKAGIISADLSQSILTAISSEMFCGCSSLETVKLPPNLAKIESRSFISCAMSKVEFGNKITEIKNEAFSHCSHLSEVLFDDSSIVSKFGQDSFSYTNISSFLIPSSVSKVESKCFKGCELLKNLTIEDIQESKLESIAADSFDGCNSLEEVVLPSTINSLNPTSFSICRSLMNIFIGDGETPGTVYRSINGAVYSSDGSALLICPCGREEFDIEGSVQIIGLKAFMNCKNLKALTFKEGSQIESLNTSVFEGCDSLTSVVFVDDNDVYSRMSGKILKEKKGSKLKTIGNKVFSGCSSLEEFSFPSSVVKIGSEAFDGCLLLKTSLPKNLERIEMKGFNGCSSLERIDLGPKVVYIGAECFFGCNSLEIVTYCGTTFLDSISFELAAINNAHIVRCFVLSSYPSNSLGGLCVSKSLDIHCNIPTLFFSDAIMGNIGKIETMALTEIVLCENIA